MTGSVLDRYRVIRDEIAAACSRAGRAESEVVVIGAAKRQPRDRVLAAWDAGLRHFGDNRVQEAEALAEVLPPGAVRHLIGPLQSNKAKRAAALFDAVHSVDRLKIARALDRHAAEAGRRIEAFLEVNLGGEETKHGFPPHGLPARVEPLAELESLYVVGLMAIPPQESDPERARLWFRRLRELRDELFALPPWAGRPGRLSMGMSADFAVAIEEGATHVRIGTALFGPRPS
ncbi:MAG: YggS family pyridoxal phosphate-dependent enzyme [Thermoanaerobaculia bacterium]|nr:YggS family pyridoxal phosphate-dependent enzyme [Thermoanaerobaculia bacterium]